MQETVVTTMDSQSHPCYPDSTALSSRVLQHSTEVQP